MRYKKAGSMEPAFMLIIKLQSILLGCDLGLAFLQPAGALVMRSDIEHRRNIVAALLHPHWTSVIKVASHMFFVRGRNITCENDSLTLLFHLGIWNWRC